MTLPIHNTFKGTNMLFNPSAWSDEHCSS